MYFTKTPHPANFEFADAYDAKRSTVRVGDAQCTAQIDAYEGDIWNVQLAHSDLWTENLCLAPLDLPNAGTGTASLSIDSEFKLTLTNAHGEVVLKSDRRGGFGLMGKASCFCFAYDAKQRYFGLGEKTFPTLDHRHRRTRFWNTDALGDFNHAQWDEQPLDPYYVSVPYLIVQSGDNFVGLLYHNPYATFADCGSDASFFNDQDDNRRVVIGSEDGLPSLWILLGPSLQELTRKLQTLVGRTPLPPTWALGYHQCKWGYKGEEDLTWLDAKMDEHAIPNDGLWLDIDYMDGYRVFTYAKEHWPQGVQKGLAALVKKGRRIVPILDPGVKQDPGYGVYDSGLKADVFCKNPQGKDYIGFVWPGLTVFPDFTMPEGRSWWAGHAAECKKLGFAGAWLDMNDPSTGAIDPMAMRFRRGTLPHEAMHNQYALGMQMATREAFQSASPDERVFLLSRSGFIGTSRYAAIWTGDNLSTRWYLRGSIPCTLNLGLSGIPFNGPDVGGFMHDTNEALMVDWVKAGFLFPFFRIHSVAFNRPQEPWVFRKPALETIRHYIRLRYKLLPYLYNVFVNHTETGDPVLRPVIYHFTERVISDDAFLVGDAILQAPCMDENFGRSVALPGKKAWFDARNGEWVNPGRVKLPKQGGRLSPLYFRHGAIIPCLPGMRTTAEKDLRDVEFHVFIKSGSSEITYTFDDGETLAYERGERSRVQVRATARGKTLELTTELVDDGYGPLRVQFVVYGSFEKVILNGIKMKTKSVTQVWTGEPIRARATL
ncbi:MAG: hypothetical protein JNM85_04030 [Chthonomonas sp.]|nr:hypothetical protein [Chthonomonas sp.]